MSNFRRVIRKMGFVRDQEGIMNRYLGEPDHWKLHLEKSKTFINSCFEGSPVKSVAVLGSGWLLDVPLDQMTGRYEKVVLVDIFHPPQIVKKAEAMKNVELVETDLSGGAIEQIWQITRHETDITAANLTDRIELSSPLQGIRADAIVSINLLNQLDIILCDFLKQYRSIDLGPLINLRRKIQKFHIEWITRSPGCLITDCEEISVDRIGVESSTPLIHTDLPVGIRTDQWRWEFDTRGTYRKGYTTHMNVRAVEWAGF